MTVAELIEALRAMPQEAEVTYVDDWVVTPLRFVSVWTGWKPTGEPGELIAHRDWTVPSGPMVGLA